MPDDCITIMGLFADDGQAAAAIRGLCDGGFVVERVHSPIPSEKINAALARPKSRVGLFTLAGGVIGFISGFLLAAFTAARWALIVGGKPVFAWVPFVIVGFEFTILFAVFGNVVGLISQARLPRVGPPAEYDMRCTGDRFGVVAVGSMDKEKDLSRLLLDQGAEIKTFNRMQSEAMK